MKTSEHKKQMKIRNRQRTLKALLAIACEDPIFAKTRTAANLVFGINPGNFTMSFNIPKTTNAKSSATSQKQAAANRDDLTCNGTS